MPATPPHSPSAMIVRAADRPESWFEEGCYITECLNIPADAALSVARARVPPRTTTRRHRLDGIVERYVILSGRGLVEIGGGSDDGGQATDDTATVAELGPGDIAVIPAGVSQRITNLAASDLVFLAICTPRFIHEAYCDLER